MSLWDDWHLLGEIGLELQTHYILSFSLNHLAVTTASPARALTASLLDYVVEEVSTTAYRTRASRSTRPGDWSGWEMPALEVIRYELFLYGYILMATLMGKLQVWDITQV